MNMQPIINNFKKLGLTLSKHSPTILTVLGGMTSVAALVEAVRVTPKVVKEIEEVNPETKLDTVKVAAKHYIPAGVMELFALGCIFGAHKITLGRAAVISTLYTTSQEKLEEYQHKVLEKFGPKKAEQVQDEIALDHVNKTFDPTNPVIMSPLEGKTRCLDTWTGRYFYSTVETIRGVVNDINEQLRGDWYVSLNEFYYALGLEGIDAGDEMGWNADEPLKVKFASHLCPDGIPCLTMEFDVKPKFRFDRL